MSGKEGEPNSFFFQRIPIYGPIISQADEMARNEGLREALGYAVDKFKWRALIRCPQETVPVLGTEPCLMIVNHPAQIEPLLVAWAITRWRKREDVFLIADADLKQMGPDSGQLFLPIYGTSTRSTRWSTSLRKRVQARFLGESDERALDRRNLDTLREGCAKIKAGGVVVITPIMDKNQGESWHPGIGWLAKKLLKKQTPVQLVMADVENTSLLDFGRFIPQANRILGDLKVTFSPPVLLREVVKQDAGFSNQALAADLQSYYDLWLKVTKLR